ncbi:MAG: hypothetical protein IKR19_10320, partial [Acholeplasmatales bacterium]|nr:hypothetical protein [Acholeplasmatales bacterium]
TRYTGNYDKYMEMYEIERRNQNIAYEKQQKEIRIYRNSLIRIRQELPLQI